MYPALSNCAIRALLFCCLNNKEQRPVYYISKAMVDAKTQYSKIEQTTLALRSAAQKLYPYFQAHQVTVLINQPLRSILCKPNLFGRMLKWAIDLSEYRIKYQPRLAIKKQVMVEFIAEIPQRSSQLPGPSKEGWWILQVNEAS